MNMSFQRAIAPGLLEGGENRGFVAAEVLGEVGQRAGLHYLASVRPGADIPLPDDGKELPLGVPV